MHIVRYLTSDQTRPRIGLRDAAGVRPLNVPSLSSMLSWPAAAIKAAASSAAAGPPLEEVTLLTPADGTMEIWAAGVTYYRSRQARLEESGGADFYQRVYDATRPEIFFKSVPWRVVTDGEPIGIRRDSALNVPEPELAIVVNSAAEIVGYTVCNDVSSRAIEGENPLYLPQAKIYAGACAIAPGIRPAWEVDPCNLTVHLQIARRGTVAWSGETSTSQLKRSLHDLVDCLFAEQHFPGGAIISTGTGIIPEVEFTLEPGDVVTIAIDQVGTLTNRVVAGKQSFGWLADGPVRPAREPAAGARHD